MRDLKLFGTNEYPIHPSAMLQMTVCSWRYAMEFLAAGSGDEGGVAGDTGSAVHAAAAAYHRGADLAGSLAAMGARNREYPQANLTDAAALFLCYARDPRNADARVVLVEEPVKFSISPAKEDRTQAPIEVIGTVDQVRREDDGFLYAWDIKSTKKDPFTMLQQYKLQLSAYCIGAAAKLNETVRPGGCIFVRQYPRNAFWKAAWRWEDIPAILEGVRHAVAHIRNGELWATPNENCQWCGMRNPDVCTAKLVELGFPR